MSTSRIAAPIRRRMMLVFDVETTGLIPKASRNPSPATLNDSNGLIGPVIDNYPHILQMSFVLYDMYEKNIVKSCDSYIKIPEHVEIPEIVTQLTGITKSMCREKGRDILEVLDEFYEAYMAAESVIAHNIDFDENMVLIELHRNREAVLEKIPYCFTLFNKIYERMRGLEKYCTMKQGTELCAITVEGRVSKKWPKLAELHQRLFDEVPDGLHNSMVDVMATLRCYLKMRHYAAI